MYVIFCKLQIKLETLWNREYRRQDLCGVYYEKKNEEKKCLCRIEFNKFIEEYCLVFFCFWQEKIITDIL